MGTIANRQSVIGLPTVTPDYRMSIKAFGNQGRLLRKLEGPDCPITDEPTETQSAIGVVGNQVGSHSNVADCRLQKQSSRQSAVEKMRGFRLDDRLGGSDCSALIWSTWIVLDKDYWYM